MELHNQFIERFLSVYKDNTAIIKAGKDAANNRTLKAQLLRVKGGEEREVMENYEKAIKLLEEALSFSESLNEAAKLMINENS